MNSYTFRFLVIALGLMVSAAAPADEDARPSIAAILRTGTLGHGIDVSLPFWRTVALRIGQGSYSSLKHIREAEIAYDGQQRLAGTLAVADWYPFNSFFRLTAGYVRNQSRTTLTSRSTGTLVLNGNPYTGADTTLDGKISFEKTAPYFGFGFGNPSARGRVGVFAEFGAIRQKPVATLGGECRAASPDCDTFTEDLAIEQDLLRAELANTRWYPVVQLGIGVRY